jgi:hypothetical protein
MWYGWHELTDRPSKYITYLRHPVRRYISFYNHIREQDGHPCSEIIRRDDLGLEEFINRENLELPKLQENLQTKLLTGNFAPTVETLRQAVENLRTHFLVGLTESFDADLLHIAGQVGWSTPLYRRRNISKKHVSVEELDASLIHEIAQCNHLDIALYEYVRANRARPEKGIGHYTFQAMQVVRNFSPVSRVRRALGQAFGAGGDLPGWLRPQ